MCIYQVCDIPGSPCKFQRKGQALPEWLAGSKMLDFIYQAVNMSLIAAGFLGFNSVTSHLIIHSFTYPGGKHCILFSVCCFSDTAMDFPKRKPSNKLKSKLLFCQLIFFLTLKILKRVYNKSEDYRTYSAHWNLCKLFSWRQRKWDGGEGFRVTSFPALHAPSIITAYGSEPSGAATLHTELQEAA